MEHGHQQLSQDDNHYDIVGAYDHGTHKRPQLFLCVADAGDEERDVCQRKDVPEQGVACSHKPVRRKKLVDVSVCGCVWECTMSVKCILQSNQKYIHSFYS